MAVEYNAVLLGTAIVTFCICFFAFVLLSIFVGNATDKRKKVLNILRLISVCVGCGVPVMCLLIKIAVVLYLNIYG
jgi:hypothetical protein